MEKSLWSPRHEALAHAVRELRLELGMTQMELSRRLGSSQTLVSNVERQERRVDLPEVHALADALGVDLRELIDRYLEVLAAQPKGRGSSAAG